MLRAGQLPLAWNPVPAIRPPSRPRGRLAVVFTNNTGTRTMQKPPDWISVPVAAELLGCTDVWVIKMINRGDLEGFRLSGRAWAVSKKSVEKNLRDYLDRDPSLSGRKRSKLS
jgi:hypothetical protein